MAIYSIGISLIIGVVLGYWFGLSLISKTKALCTQSYTKGRLFGSMVSYFIARILSFFILFFFILRIPFVHPILVIASLLTISWWTIIKDKILYD
jgi:hypothetical protein